VHHLNIFLNAGAESAEVRGEVISFFYCFPPIAQDIHPGRKISWDIRPSRMHVRPYFPSGMNMPNDRLWQFSRERNCRFFKSQR